MQVHWIHWIIRVRAGTRAYDPMYMQYTVRFQIYSYNFAFQFEKQTFAVFSVLPGPAGEQI